MICTCICRVVVDHAARRWWHEVVIADPECEVHMPGCGEERS